MKRLQADFNGLFGDLLCLSHGDTCRDEAGNNVPLTAGMRVTAFEPDIEDGYSATAPAGRSGSTSTV